MFNKFFGFKFLFIVFSLLLSFLFTKAYAIRHNPNEIFNFHLDDTYSVNIKQATGVDAFHARGHRGQGYTVAILDHGFHPEHVQYYERLGLLHPAVKRLNLALTTDERLDSFTIDNLDHEQGGRLAQLVANPREDHATQMERIRELRKRKELFDALNRVDTDHHGPLVAGAFHELAPGASLLLIDLKLVSGSTALQIARENHVDAINMSVAQYPLPPEGPLNPIDLWDREYINELEQTALNIPLFVAAGNDSGPEAPLFIDRVRTRDGGFSPSSEFEAFNGRGRRKILFVGGVKYAPDGDEAFDPFSQLPTQAARSNYILGPGENVLVHYNDQESEIVSGTSFAAPETAAVSILTKQALRTIGINPTPDQLIELVYDSGHALAHNIHDFQGGPTFKVLNARNLVQRIFGDEPLVLNIPNPPPQFPANVQRGFQPIRPENIQPAVQENLQPAKKTKVRAPKRPRAAKRRGGMRSSKRRITSRKARVPKRRVASRRVRSPKRRVASRRGRTSKRRVSASKRSRHALRRRSSR